MILLLLLTVLAAVSRASSNCLLGACYPPSGDLLLGRAQQLFASSTCGLTGSEIYCTPYQQRRMKCCPCDSQNPKGPLAHTVQEIVSTAEPDRWWQSPKGVSPVTIQLDPKGLFQLDSLVLDFKGPRPRALVIERSLDNGRTWLPYVYMATHCPSAFPGVPTSTPLKLDDTYCYTLPPIGSDAYKDHQIHFRPLEQYKYIPVPKDQKIEGVSGITGLRVRLTELGEVPQMPPGRLLSRFFALKEMRMIGRCMCHGHANKCLPDTRTSYSNAITVHSQCDCQHNTAGPNCERCAELYNDLPWRAAEEDDPHMCKRCECNNHAQRCRFDQAVYEASGRRSGGVCVECMHHTTGPKCDQCAPGYQPNPRCRMDQPDACIRCVCNAAGTVNGALCDDTSGSCRCKSNVEGPECDSCVQGSYNLSASNPQGCTKCACSPTGSMSERCDPLTGQCLCRLQTTGLKCESCSPGFWRPAGSDLCVPCACDPTASLSNICDQSGQCRCKAGFGGSKCAECATHMFGDPYRGCKSCDCDKEGTFPEGCDKQTGVCLCRPGVTGARCDSCSRGRCDAFPRCPMCPSCFFTLDAQRQNISAALGKLRLPDTPRPSQGFGPRINALESSLNNLKNSISLPPAVVRKVDKALDTIDQLQSEFDGVKKKILPLEKTNLEPELDKLQDLLNLLNLNYKIKIDTLKYTTSPTDTRDYTAIKNAHSESTDAARNVTAANEVLENSRDIREGTDDELKQVLPVNDRTLSQLNSSLTSKPDLSPLAKMVCGKVLSKPCTPLQCGSEELCPDTQPPCEPGKPCLGALPLGKKAVADAEPVQDKLDALSKNISDAAAKLQKTQETTNLVRQSADKLDKKMKEARDALEEDLKTSRDVVKEIKDFLSDPSSNLTHIQRVSDWVLKAKLPVSLPALKAKLDELKSLADSLPDSTAVLNQAQPQLEAAKKLLQEAQDARDTAKGVKADVDDLKTGLESVEESLLDLRDKLDNSTDLIDNLSDEIAKVKDQLSPAEKILDDVAGLLTPMKPNLEELKNLLEEARQGADDTQDKADEAEMDTTDATENMKDLEKQLETLKDKTAGRTPDGDAAQLGERLTKLQQNAKDLVNTTDDMLKALDGKADSIRQLQGEIITKSSLLEGLDTKLENLLAQLRKRAQELRSCQG
ncbi:laminin subunit beta-3 [Eucyclogobius newberryi]|uniref:laminin subunit beta-3 n=1 Tax=Eucyclogobius newberryi TaxID=166745 RepID=UPI003B5ABBA7